jgi:hypothetical protein
MITLPFKELLWLEKKKSAPSKPAQGELQVRGAT